MAQLIEKPIGVQNQVPANGHLVEAPPGIEGSFRRLADEWSRQTMVMSSVTEIVAHPAYREVIGLGSIAVPLILKELQERPALWFAALREITGENPVPAEDAGRVSRMREHWLSWGRERGLL